jgi:hypothetical protein
MAFSKILSAITFIAISGLSFKIGYAAPNTLANINDMCVCSTGQSNSQLSSNDQNPCLVQSKAQLDEATRLNESEEARRIIRELARKVKEIASCDVGLATEIAGLAAAAPDWVQVAFGAALDGTGTGSIGGGVAPSGNIGGGNSSGSPG